MNLINCIMVVVLCSIAVTSTDARACTRKRNRAPLKDDENYNDIDIDDDADGTESNRFLTGPATSSAAINRLQSLIDTWRQNNSNTSGSSLATSITPTVTGITTNGSSSTTANNSAASAILPQILGQVVAANAGRRPNRQRGRRRRRPNNGPRVYVVRQ